MSTQPYKCESCDVDGTFARAGKFPEDDKTEATYGVAWQCPGCNAVSLDLCPLGPIEPVKDACLNCGAIPPSDPTKKEEACPDCGMSHDEMLKFLRIEDPSSRSLEKAESAFDTGLYRHGFAIIDALLQDAIKSGEEGAPKNAKLWESKATQYQILRLNKAAARCYKRSIALEPKALLDIALACALSDEKDNEGAIAIYDTLITESKDKEILAIAHANRGNLHEAAGRTEPAIADYKEAIAREPERVTHYQNYSRLFTKRKRWKEALDVVTRGLESVKGDEDRIPLLIEKARANNEQELAEAGLAAADELLALSPNHPRGLYQRAWALGLVGRLDEAATDLEKLLEIEPESKDGAKALAKIQAARTQAKKPWWKFW